MKANGLHGSGDLADENIWRFSKHEAIEIDFQMVDY